MNLCGYSVEVGDFETFLNGPEYHALRLVLSFEGYGEVMLGIDAFAATQEAYLYVVEVVALVHALFVLSGRKGGAVHPYEHAGEEVGTDGEVLGGLDNCFCFHCDICFVNLQRLG